METILKTKSLSKNYEGVRALRNVDLDVKKGEIFGIIGPNGAGKTTLFNVVTGLEPSDDGEVFIMGEDITGLQVWDIISRGVGRTFQNIRLFGDLTVLDNVLVGNHLHIHTGVLGSILMTRHARACEESAKKKAMECLELMGLAEIKDEYAQNLPYGMQKKLEIARALTCEPKLLFLDEPSAGMNPNEVAGLMELIAKIRDLGPTVILIEHNMRLVMGICERIAVLNFGEKIAEGTPGEIQNNRQVIEAYLGEEKGA